MSGIREPADRVEIAIAEVHRTGWAHVLGSVVHFTRDLDLAEDMVQDAFVAALDTWPREGIPANPAAWLITTAKRKALDRIRRQATFERKLPLLVVPEGEDEGDDMDGDHIPDERLRLIFTCCHPALSLEARVALTLRLVCGIQTPDVARLLLVSEATMAARITRAKKKIAIAGIPYRVPSAVELVDRLPAVLGVIYLLFTEGHTAGRGDRLVQDDIIERSLRLATTLVELLPDEGEVLGLLALIRLTDARRHTRVDAAGELVLLADQDRTRWDRTGIEDGLRVTERALRLSAGRRPGRYAVQAAIAAVHAEPVNAADTDWAELVALYDLLLVIDPSPVVALSRAVAIGERDGAAHGMMALAAVEDHPALVRYHMLPALRADFLRRLGRDDDALLAYDQALNLTGNAVEQSFLRRRIAELHARGTRPRGACHRSGTVS
ncbi:MAG TPA: RNA polymerase sigma factor [Thermomicrobiales bacterium]|nr:RNA polymerase sigma factor [Thermomicrobiales bacterium]